MGVGCLYLKSSMQTPLFRVRTLGAPDQDRGKFMSCSPAIDGTMFVIPAHVSWVDELMQFLAVPRHSNLDLIPRITRQIYVSLSREQLVEVVERFGLRAYFQISHILWEYSACLDTGWYRFELYVQKAHGVAMDLFFFGAMFSALMSISVFAEEPHGYPLPFAIFSWELRSSG